MLEPLRRDQQAVLGVNAEQPLLESIQIGHVRLGSILKQMRQDLVVKDADHEEGQRHVGEAARVRGWVRSGSVSCLRVARVSALARRVKNSMLANVLSRRDRACQYSPDA